MRPQDPIVPNIYIKLPQLSFLVNIAGFDFLKGYLESYLKDIGPSVVNQWFGSVPDLGMDIVKHKTGFSVEIPVDAKGEVSFLSSLYVLTVQVQIGDAQAQFPCSPAFFKKMEVMVGGDPQEHTPGSIVASMFTGEEITGVPIKSPEPRIPHSVCIGKGMEILPLEREGAGDHCQFTMKEIHVVRWELSGVDKHVVGQTGLGMCS